MNETEQRRERECMQMRLDDQRRENERLRMNLDAAAMEETRLLQIIARQGFEIERHVPVQMGPYQFTDYVMLKPAR